MKINVINKKSEVQNKYYFIINQYYLYKMQKVHKTTLKCKIFIFSYILYARICTLYKKRRQNILK